jgi:hypothetical protein
MVLMRQNDCVTTLTKRPRVHKLDLHKPTNTKYGLLFYQTSPNTSNTQRQVRTTFSILPRQIPQIRKYGNMGPESGLRTQVFFRKK